ncbi:MAG: S1C family serine protease [Candidatus Dormibacteria bacterium]
MDPGPPMGDEQGRSPEGGGQNVPLPWVPPSSSPPPPLGSWQEDEPPLSQGGGGVRRRSPLRRAVSILAVVALVGLIGSGTVLFESDLHGSANPTAGSGPSPSPSLATSSPTNATELLRAVAATDLPEIVMVVSVGATSEELGTAWPLDGDGDFLTNDHVVHTGQSFHVVLASGQQYAADVVNDDPGLDLAEIHVWGFSEQPLPISDALPPMGEPVVVLAAQGATGHTPVTDSQVNGLDESARVTDAAPGELSSYSGMIRIRARIFPGNSGGPVITPEGQVVAILTLAAASGPGAFAIPIAHVDAVIEGWLRS